MAKYLVLPDAELAPIIDSSLFYPCAGADFLAAVQLVSPVVTDFHFVDKAYFCPGHQDTKHWHLDRSANRQAAVLAKNEEYQLLDVAVVGTPVSYVRHRSDPVLPCVRRETYRHLPTERIIHISRHRNDGEQAFLQHQGPLGVFFYRGDSQGEGGSGICWLSEEKISMISDRLLNGGLFITDGSQNDGGLEYRYLWSARDQELCQQKGIKPADLPSFQDRHGRRFTCLANIGMRYGPTLVWQVAK